MSNFLFQPSPLPDVTGELRERWQQDGSTVVNDYTANFNADETFYTVTAGKTLYVKQIVVGVSSATDSDAITFNDGATGKYKVRLQAANIGDTIIANFSVPLAFSTNVNGVETGDVSLTITFTGWEE